ncbi:glucose dehydrogenase [FAD, quinone]-like [Mizuhopecten yessoensis]|uniref:glucose dehydrogenase [FAD, quinone]-like n=1 Tax=Mizuhopecten yessoensis TaxID=6573 RepID=UPI000B45BCCF|nr:glucose dehydrogenase [FAD, quinone]-like [Mizuhopecten yessoensis]
MKTVVATLLTISVAIATTYYLRVTKPDGFVRSFNQSYDYIIVGGGAAGLVLANRLSEDADVTVLVLEAGKSESDKPIYDVPYNAPKAQMTEADWIYRTVPQKHAQWGMKNNVGIWPQGKGLGGSTLLNGLVYIRGSRHDYDTWAANGCEGWSYDEILPYFLKTEDMRETDGFDEEYHSRGGPIAISDTTKSEIADVYFEAAKEIGFKVHDCNGNDGIQDGFCRVQAIIGEGQRCTAARGFLHPVLGRDNLHVAIESHVTKVVIENKRAVGVEFIQQGRKKHAAAKREVILTAGTVGSAQLLLLSGVGPKDHLTELGIPVVADLPVGSTLRDHMMFFVKADIDKPISYTSAKVFTPLNWLKYYFFGTGLLTSNAAIESQAFVRTDPDSQAKSPDIQLTLFSTLEEHGDSFDHFNYKDEINEALFRSIHGTEVMPEGYSIDVVLIQPKSKGSLRLVSRDPFDYPLLDPNYLSDAEDIKTFIRGIRYAQKMMKTDALKNLGTKFREIDIPGCREKTPDSDEQWECFVRHLATTIYHPASTCKMGALSDPTAVVDPQLRVKGISGLRVADCSVMPNLTSGNTMAPTFMIAEKAADLIRGITGIKVRGTKKS